jgi:hypothetical protein
LITAPAETCSRTTTESDRRSLKTSSPRRHPSINQPGTKPYRRQFPGQAVRSVRVLPITAASDSDQQRLNSPGEGRQATTAPALLGGQPIGCNRMLGDHPRAVAPIPWPFVAAPPTTPNTSPIQHVDLTGKGHAVQRFASRPTAMMPSSSSPCTDRDLRDARVLGQEMTVQMSHHRIEPVRFQLSRGTCIPRGRRHPG